MMNGVGVMIRVSDLRNLCVSENWFTSGSNEQYEKLFECTRMYNSGEASLYSLVAMIYICSSVGNEIHKDGYMRDIEDKLMKINHFD